MSFIPALLLSVIFLALGLIHFSWAVGSEWGMDAVLPTNLEGRRILDPGQIDSAIVGFGLFGFGLFYLCFTPLVDWSLPSWVTKYGGWIIPTIFLLRTVGDFKYVGLFKKIKNTRFAKMDDRLFSPLCLIISLLGLGTILLNN